MNQATLVSGTLHNSWLFSGRHSREERSPWDC